MVDLLELIDGEFAKAKEEGIVSSWGDWADKAEVSRNYLTGLRTKLRAGAKTEPKADNLKRLAIAIGRPEDFFLFPKKYERPAVRESTLDPRAAAVLEAVRELFPEEDERIVRAAEKLFRGEARLAGQHTSEEFVDLFAMCLRLARRAEIKIRTTGTSPLDEEPEV